MKNEKNNCCHTENSHCNTQSTNCCTVDKKSTFDSTKKKAGLGILILAVIFALVSAFTTDSSPENESCSVNEEGCTTSCGISESENSCCSEN